MDKTYLSRYNLILASGWALFLILSFLSGFHLSKWLFLLLWLCQSAAILEIVHAAKGLVNSPVQTTAVQVGSRMFVLVVLSMLPPESLEIFPARQGFIFLGLAWGITEVIRYGYYYSQINKLQIEWLTIMRYSLFLILYPLGVLGEWGIFFGYLGINGSLLKLENLLLIIVLAAYIPLFPQMYRHMIWQRKKKLGTPTQS